ncbi:MAG: hypothetical protein ABIN01_18985, partial [Ferruginibacter sp.]
MGQLAPTGSSFTTNPTNFNIDGFLQKQIEGNGDWLQKVGGSPAGSYLFDDAGNSLNPAAFHFVDGFDGNDKVFDGSNTANENPVDPVKFWKWKVGGATNKSNINHALLYLSKDQAGDSWGMFSADRESGVGTCAVDFEFLQKKFVMTTDNKFQSDGLEGGRTLGDIIVSVQFKGGNIGNIIFLKWVVKSGGGYEYQEFAPALGDAFAKVNTTDITVPYKAFGANTTYTPNTFIEGAINLTKLIQTGIGSTTDPCSGANFKTLFIKTKVTDGFEGNMDDFLEPQQINLSIGATSISYNNPICKGDVSSLPVIFGINAVTQTGTFSALPAGLSINSTSGLIDVTNSNVGTYTVTFSYSVNNCAKSSTATVVINASPIKPVVGITQPSCLKSTGDVTLTSVAEAGTTYTLSQNNIVIKTANSSGVFADVATGTYQLKATNANCSTNGDDVVINVQPTTTTAPATTVDQPTCLVSTGTVYVTGYDATINAGYSYTLTLGNTVLNAVAGVFSNVPPGTYTFNASNGSCSATGADVIVQDQPQSPSAYNVTGGGAYCSGGSGVAVGLDGSQSGVNYQLFNGASPVGSAVAGTGAAISFGSQTTAGNYTVVATNTTTLCTNNMTGSTSITINPLPTTFNVTGGGAYCSGGSGIAVGLSGSQSGVNYQLFNGASPVGSAVAGTGAAISFGS